MSDGQGARRSRSAGRWVRSWLPFFDLPFLHGGDGGGGGRGALSRDAVAALSVTFMSIPQGIAYATIAGLPPAMGLYASCVPTIVGSLFRSSRHVIAGPTNALSLLVGAVGAAAADLDPVPTVLLLAFLVGAMQVGAGLLRLGVLVDYVSISVVVGYITGAGVLIAVGQLPNLTETLGADGNLFQQVAGWSAGLAQTNGWTLGFGLATVAVILGLRRIDRRLPGPMIALTLATLLSWALDASSLGLRRLADLTPIPVGLPPLTLPGQAWTFDGWRALLPLAGAVMVLSLVESSAVARALAGRTGQRLEMSTEFTGQGLANLSAAFFGGYPVSGSLARSALNQRSGAVSRLGGVMNGLMVLLVLLFLGPAADHTPIAAIAGLLIVVSLDLVDVERIRPILRARPSDAFAFAVTVLGTWTLRLDHAIYVGVALSLVMYLRRARLLTVHEIVFDEEHRLLEVPVGDGVARRLRCAGVRIINVEGQLFFGSASELTDVLDELASRGEHRAVILRLRRAYGLDASTALVLESAAERLAARGKHLFLVGVRQHARDLLDRTGATGRIGDEYVFPTTLTWFEAMDAALNKALEVVGEHACGPSCPVARHLATHDFTPIHDGDDADAARPPVEP